MIIATAGHVDHGKTELIKALTGVDTDRLPEEKARGLSIDLGFAYEALPDGQRLGYVDVPGHEKFIRNMLAGVGGIDLGLLVVAADDGVMPQTREHFAILSLLGISECVVAVTKVDRVDDQRIAEVGRDVVYLLGHGGIADAPIFNVCAPRRIGVDALRETILAKARSLVQRSAQGYFRLAVDRAFTLKGIGLVVTGMVFSGQARLEDSLMLSPSGLPVRVRGIRAHDMDATVALCGERCAINIAGRGLSESNVRRGDWLLHPNLHAPTRRIDVELSVLDTESTPLKHWTPTHLHVGAMHGSARVAVLQGGALQPGEQGLAQLVLSEDICVVRGDRFVLRDQSARRTLAGGRVLDPFSPKRGRARPLRLAAVQAMRQTSPEDILLALAEHNTSGVDVAEFSKAQNIVDEDLRSLIDTLDVIEVGRNEARRVIGVNRWRVLLEEIEKVVGAYHERLPEEPGPNTRDVELSLQPHVEVVVLGDALQALVVEGRLGRRGQRVHLPTHEIRISEQDRQLWARAASRLAPGEGSPLSLHQAAEELGVDKRILETSLKRGVKVGLMLPVAKNRYVPSGYVLNLAKQAESLARTVPDEGFSAAQFRDCVKMGRNFAIDLLEYFDRVGFTERVGNTRRVKRPAESVFTDTTQLRS